MGPLRATGSDLVAGEKRGECQSGSARVQVWPAVSGASLAEHSEMLGVTSGHQGCSHTPQLCLRDWFPGVGK